MQMRSDIAILVDKVSKAYEISNREDKSKNIWKGLFEPGSKVRRAHAINDVSLEVYKGETLGIIGHNGAGKSTLLRIISGITEPDSGSVHVNGIIAPILALQGGFNAQRTGRDNVYLKGATMGLSRAEIDKSFDSIAAFADIGAAIEQPLRTYSNGMRARLAFAVAFNTQPDILIIDETLTVGDEIFRRKCMDRIISVKESGATILFVTHGYNLVLQMCDRAVLLDKGERLLVGDPKTVVERFHELVYAQAENKAVVRESIKEQDLNGEGIQRTLHDGKSVRHVDDIRKDDLSNVSLISQTRRELVKQGAIINDVRVFNHQGEAVNTLRSKADYRINIPIWLTEPASRVRATIAVKTIEGIIVTEQTMTFDGESNNEIVRPKTQIYARFNFHNLLVDGVYAIDVFVTGEIAGKDIVLHGIIDAALVRVETGVASHNRGVALLIEPVLKDESQEGVMPARLAELSKC